MIRYMTLAAIAAGCTAPEDAGPRWIAVDRDAIATVRAAAPAELAEVTGDVAVLEVDARDLEAISRSMHLAHHRCGGFALHASLAAARASLAPPSVRFADVTYTLDNAATVAAALAGLDEARLLTTIEDLSAMPTRYYTSPTGIAASTWLRDKWQAIAAGHAGVTVELFPHAWQQKSVIAKIPGATKPDEVVVLGAHLDSISQVGGNAPGADDDASGIATLTEAFRALMAAGYRPDRSVHVIGYSAEEVGLRGSDDIASAYAQDGVNVVGVMQLDMTNYKGSPKDIYFLTDYVDAEQTTFLEHLVDTYVTGATWGTTACGYACSDHASWNRNGYRAVMPAEARFADSNPEIHSPNDTLAVSDNSASHAFTFAQLAVAYVAELAKGSTPLPNHEPTVTITSAATLPLHASLAATATDDEDGDLGAAIAWTADGTDLGTGAAIVVDLSPGSHELRATVTDSRGATASAARTVTVRADGGGGGDDDDDGGHGGCSTGGGAGLAIGLALLALRRRS